LLIASACVASIAACNRGHTPSPQLRPSDDSGPIHVTAAAAEARQIPQSLSLTGTLVPDQQSDVTPLVGGRVTEVYVERGTIVHANDQLMRLRDVDYRLTAQAASASLQQSRARLGITANEHFDAEQVADVRAARAARDLAEDSLRRSQQLAQSGSISDQELQRATSQAASAREQYTAALNGARAQYFQYQSAGVQAAQAQRNVADSIVRAPFDGEIAERRANVGEYVTPQRAVVTLVRTDPLRIELQVPQEQIPYVQRGQAVELHIDAFPTQSFPGTVRYISAAVRQDTRSLIAEAVVPNTGGTLRPGLFATARLNLAHQQDVVSVPTNAVLTEAGTSRVFVIVDGRVQERVVRVADRRPNEILLSQGVTAGERVATDQLDRLSDGARVQ
jgi:RND family efflux transporter MFP subunit